MRRTTFSDTATGSSPRPQRVRDVAVAARGVRVLERLAHARPQPGMLVGPRYRPALVLIGALRYPQGTGELFQSSPRRRPQLVYDQGLLPVRHRAGAFGFYNFRRRPQDVVLELELAHALLETPLEAVVRPVIGISRGFYGTPVRRRGARRFCGSGPIVDQRGARRPQHGRHVLAGHARSHERHGLCLQSGIVMAPRPAGLPLVRRVTPVQPVVQRLTRGIPQLAHRARHRPAALVDHVDGHALLLVRVAWHSRTPNRTDSVQLFVRILLSLLTWCPIHHTRSSAVWGARPVRRYAGACMLCCRQPAG